MTVKPLVEPLKRSPEASGPIDRAFSQWSGDPLRRRLLALADVLTALVFSALFAWTEHLSMRSILELDRARASVARRREARRSVRQGSPNASSSDGRRIARAARVGARRPARWSACHPGGRSKSSRSRFYLSSSRCSSRPSACVRSHARSGAGRCLEPASWSSAKDRRDGDRRKLELFRDIHAVVAAELSVETARHSSGAAADLAPGKVDRLVIASGSPTDPVMDELLALLSHPRDQAEPPASAARPFRLRRVR